MAEVIESFKRTLMNISCKYQPVTSTNQALPFYYEFVTWVFRNLQKKLVLYMYYTYILFLYSYLLSW